MSNLSILLTTFESREQAKPVINQLLAEKLAACIQEIDISSHYNWNDELCNDSEVLVLFKTTRAAYPALEQRLMELHPYDTPEIVQLPVLSASVGYEAWVQDEVVR